MRCDLSDFRYAEFQNSAVLVDEGDDVGLPVFWERPCHRPHMLFDHIFFEEGDMCQLPCIFHSYLWMHTAVAWFAFWAERVVLFSVVVEQIVEQSCSCGRTGIEAEFPAHHIAVIWHVQTVLKTGSRYMVSDILELFKFVRIYKIGDTAVIAAKWEVFFWANSFKLSP